MNEVVIDGVTYIPKTSRGDMKIIILDRGFVYVGQLEELDDRIIIHDARNIIRWGTTKHLAELQNGPFTDTKLGDRCRVEAYKRSVIHIIEVSDDGWR